MKNKKRILFLVSAVVLLALVIVGGIEIYKYNTMLYRVGIARSMDGRIEQPVLVMCGHSEFGASEKALDKSRKIQQEWNEKIGNLFIDLNLSYSEDKEHIIRTTIRVVGDKTEIHLSGTGIPNGETEKKVIDETVMLDYVFILDKDVCY